MAEKDVTFLVSFVQINIINHSTCNSDIEWKIKMFE